MKTFSKLLSEVAQPKAGDEIHFKAKHEIEKFPHSHAGDETFKGSTKKMPKRRADYEKGNDEDVYEAMDPVGKEDDDIDNDGDVDSSDKYLHARRKAIGKAMKKKMKEEVDQIDEISKKTLGSYVKKASYDAASNAAKFGAGETDKKGGSAFVKAHNRLRGISKATDRLTKEEVELDEAKWMVTHKKEQGTTGKYIDSTQFHPDERSARLHKGKLKYTPGVLKGSIAMKKVHPQNMTKEEVEQLDELSPNLLHRYIKKAAGSAAGIATGMGADAAGKGTIDPKKARKFTKRMKGISGASGRLADKANMAEDAWEEIPMMSRQLQFIMYAAQEIMSYLNDCDDMCVDPEEWFQNKLAHVHGQMMTLHGYVEGDRRMNMSMYGEEVELDEVKKVIGKDIGYGTKITVDRDGSIFLTQRGHPNGIQEIVLEASQVKLITKMLNEEVEQIDEISKKTLGSYVQKASRDMYDKGGRSVYHSTKANKASGPFEKETKKKHRAKAVEMERKASNRDTGIARAMSRLTKEDTELSEVTDQERLSARKIQRDAQTARHGIARKPGESMVKYLTRAKKYKEKMQKESLDLDEVTRSAIKRPVKYTDARGVTRTRMTTTRPVQRDEYGQEKMSESLQEAVKPGRMKLDDGSSITVSKKDAELLNQMFNDLNKTNRKKMQDTMMSDKEGYEEIVGFAREAL